MIFKSVKLLAIFAMLGFSMSAFAHGPGHHHPHPGPVPGHGFPPAPYGYPYTVTCYAQNAFGVVYYGVGYNIPHAQSIALQYCYSSGLACIVTGCH